VPQAALRAGEAYEAFIHRTTMVPTRNNAHDFFNGLIWLSQPVLKRRLNALQADAIARDGIGARRGPLRDALTVFDENGALLLGPPELHAALAARYGRRLCVELRPLWRQARLLILGHALLEKLLQPRKPICAHVLLVDSIAHAGGQLDAATLAVKPFHPLPVLGVPQWWPANEAPGFYADVTVFRPRRLVQTSWHRPQQPWESTSCASF